MKKVELLSPAGTRESLIAAVRAGADAVYLGGSRFSARAYAGNFTDEELEEYVDYCHLRGVKVYIAVNTLIEDSEADQFMEYVGKLYEIGVDALILQDIGMIERIRKYLPEMELHASTQMTTNTTEDAFFLKQQGISRIVVSRELSTSEIRTIKEETGLEIEVFVHGALCLCYSGKCYFSSMNGGRSGNRGACAQPCREEYESNIKTEGAYFLSPKDLRTIENIDEICQSGADSLKIEGRMKRPEYVYLVTRNYRQAMADNRSLDLKDLSRQLEKVFNRSFTEGYLLGRQGEAIINTQFQKPQGSPLGKVISYDRKTKRLKVKLIDELVKGDGLTIGERVGRILKGKQILQEAKSGEVIELDCVRDVPVGTMIHKTYDHRMMQYIEEGMSREKRLPIGMSAVLKEGDPALLRGWFIGQENQVEEQQSEERIEKAEKAFLTADKVKQQLSKVGDYPFEVKTLEVVSDEGIYLPIKTLNQLRRELADRLVRAKIDSFKRKKNEDEGVLPLENQSNFRRRQERSQTYSPSLSLLVRNREQLDAVCRFGKEKVGRIYISSLDRYHRLKEEGHPFEIVYCLPSVIRQDDRASVESMMEGVEVFLSGSMGMFWKYPERKAIADYSLNAYNSFSHNFYHEQGIETTLSIETLYADGEYPSGIIDRSMVEVPIYLYPRLMTTEYCPHKGRDGRCKEKVCQLPRTSMRNRRGEQFTFRRELGCKTVIYPLLPKRLEIPRIQRLIEEGYRRFRIECMDESADDIRSLIESYKF